MKPFLIPIALALLAPFAAAEIPRPTDAPGPLTPEESAAAFRLPDGFRMEIVASEPLIASPSAVCWDERGRMFVSELHGYNLAGHLDIEELNKSGQLDTQVRRVRADEKFLHAARKGSYGVVKMLRDTNGDGRMDKVDVWAKDLPPCFGLVPARGGIIAACPPDIIYLRDGDGDGVAEIREILFTGFGTGELERGINAPQWAADGWIYFGFGWRGGEITGPKLASPVALPDADFRIRSDGSAIEPLTGGTQTFGFAMTEAGDRFTVATTSPAIHVAPLPWRYLVRNPDAATASLEESTGDGRAYSISKPHPWRSKRASDPEYFQFYKSRYGAPESEADGWFTAACGPLVYLDHALPGLHGQYFVCEPAGNLIHRALLKTDGPRLEIQRAPGEEKSEFAASHDAWSHPMNLTHAPDGAIWVVDYYREIIEDYSAIPRHLQQQYGLYRGHDRGRIYRLTHRDLPPSPPADLSALDPERLARETASPLLWRRQTAQRLLTEQGGDSATPTLRALLKKEDSAPSSIIAALHTLDGLGSLSPEDARPLLTHADAAIRVHTLQLADRWLAKDEATLEETLAAAGQEKDPRVLLQFAMSLGESAHPRAFAMLTRLAREQGNVRWMDAALLSSLHDRGGEMLAALLREPGASAPLLAPLAKAIAGRGHEPELALALTVADQAPAEVKTILQSAFGKSRQAPVSKSPSAATAPDAAAPVMEVSDETFRKFLAALPAARDLQRGHEVFTTACAACHQVRGEGHVYGPDLLGEVGVAEETLVRHLLLPNERIRPGYETTVVEATDGVQTIGLLKADNATSLTILLPGGVEQVILKKNITSRRQIPGSLMPSFATALTPAAVANLLAWLRTHVAPPPAPR